jgi:ATP/maltotriose-dependent transcriptional regulator MalT
MLETLREFALEQLEAADETQVVQLRHAVYALQLAETAEPHLQSPEQMAWLQRLEGEHGNLRTALVWCLSEPEPLTSISVSRDARNDHGRLTVELSALSQVEIGLRLTVALGTFWQVRGYWTEGRAWLALALEQSFQGAPTLRAMGLARASQIVRNQGAYDQAYELAKQSLLLAQEHDYQRSIPVALYTLGRVARARGNDVEADRLFRESLAIARRFGDRSQMGAALVALGERLRIQGDMVQADELLGEALRIGREGDPRISVQALSSLANVANAQHDRRLARELFQESLALARELGYKTYVAQILNGLGETARIEQDYAQAAAHYRDSLQLAQELGDKANVNVALLNLGHVVLHQHSATQAAAHFAASVALAQELGIKRFLADGLTGLGAVAVVQEQPQQAARLLSAAMALREAMGYQLDAADRFEHHHYLAKVHTQLDPAIFEAAWADGQALSLESAIAEAEAVAHAAQLVTDLQPSIPEPQHPAGLTEREVEVLHLVAQGLTNPQIAEQLIISPRTVHAHLRAIYGKLEVSTRSAATRFAIEHGLA